MPQVIIIAGTPVVISSAEEAEEKFREYNAKESR